MKRLTDQRILLVVGVIFMVLLLVNTLLTRPVNAVNLTYIEGNFVRIEKNKIKRKVSFWYDLTIEQNHKPLKISAEYTNCFDFNNFNNEVKVGDVIRIGYTENDGPFRNGSIAKISKDNKEYFNFDCRNSGIEESKVIIPIITSTAILIFIGLFIWMTKTKRY